jgi:hypothetical protein
MDILFALLNIEFQLCLMALNMLTLYIYANTFTIYHVTATNKSGGHFFDVRSIQYHLPRSTI